MARPKKGDAPNLSDRVNLTVGAIERLVCPTGKQQAFMRDSEVPGLRVRVTAANAKSFVFEAKLNRQTIRRTIGDVRVWSIDQARTEARRLAVMLDTGQDPREIERQQQAEKVAAAAAATAQALTVGELWPRYLEAGRPKRSDAWKPRYLADLKAMAKAGGEPKKRGEGVTRTGPLYPLLALPLAGVNEDTLTTWFERESLSGRHQATRALMMFRGFLRWCAARPEYREMTNREAGKAPAIVENLPRIRRRTDALESTQVAAWWSGVQALNNLTASVYLRGLLLTGARREELAALTWANVDFRLRKITIADKVDATRTIPLTPYMAQLLSLLPTDGLFVFAGSGKSGHIADTRSSTAKVLESAAIDGLTIHGLRRSFALLGEVAGAPAGAIAQVMGHKPSATHEGYKPRTVEALRPFLERIEMHILSLANVPFVPEARLGKLQLMA